MASSSNTQRPSMPMIDAMASVELDESLFASSDTLEDIESYSTLLAKCGELRLLPRAHGAALLNVTSDDEKLGFRDSFNANSNKINLCIRDHEIAASMMIGSFTPHSGTGQVVMLNHENVVFAINPPKDEHVDKTPQSEAGPLKIVVEARIPLQTGLAAGADPVEFLLRRYTEIQAASANQSKSKARKVDMPFAEHLGIILSLLRQCNDAKTADELKQRRDHLETYVMAVSCHKMTRRANLGKSKDTDGKRKYFDVMSMALHDIPTEELDDVSTIPDETVLNEVPNTSQLKQIRAFAKWAKLPELPRDVEKLPIYDRRGRRLVHNMLSKYLKAAVAAVEDLKRQMSKGKPGKLLKHLETVQSLVLDAKTNVKILNQFLQRFNTVLDYHLGWLERFKWKQSVKATGDEPGSEGHGMSEAKDLSDSEDEDLQAHGDVDLPTTSLTPEVVGDSTADDEEELESIEQGYLAPMNESSSNWAAGAMKYLKLICLHESSLISETDWKPEHGQSASRRLESRIMDEAKFALIDIQRAKFDEQRTKSINDCLNELVRDDKKLDKSKLQGILGQSRKDGKWVEDLSCLDAKWFSGSMHCEAILVALLMLGKTDGIEDKLTEEWLNRNGIFAAKSDVLRLFEKMAPFVGISKRNCPVCFAVCKAAASMNILQASHELIIPGHHTTYSAVALPPFIPREVAGTVLVNLKMAANDYLTRL
ncbi:hypothetical protein CBER1_11957 [Cercospora berteroae]|uniref:Uncharacterized protein n=1 Tax=Cercospora berteroae TaxID=357750 RepID=A0A2S6C0L1_9PEZI|nr:hypothetical protein CBER1_11957 [Cercospora berteroae]